MNEQGGPLRGAESPLDPQPTAEERGPVKFLDHLLSEVLLGGVACLVGLGVIAAAKWGWERDPFSTALLGIALAAFLAYGLWQLFMSRRETSQLRRLAIAAIAFALIVGLWLSYILTSCSCLL